MVQTIDAVGVLIENEHGEILVLRRNADKTEGNKWGLPGGKLRLGEDEYAALAREVFEEINYPITQADIIYIKKYVWSDDDGVVNFSVFNINNTKDIKIILNKSESSEYGWFKPHILYKHDNLMRGLYPILKDTYNL